MKAIFTITLLALLAACEGGNRPDAGGSAANETLPEGSSRTNPTDPNDRSWRICHEMPNGLFADARTGEYLLVSDAGPFVSYCSANQPEWRGLKLDCWHQTNRDSIQVQFAGGSKHYLRFATGGDTLFCTNPDGTTQPFVRRYTAFWAGLVSRFDSLWHYPDSATRRRIESECIAQTRGRVVRQGHLLLLHGPGGKQLALQDTSPGQSHFDNHREFFLEYYDSVYQYSRIQCGGYEYGADIFYFHNSGQMQEYAFSEMQLSPNGKIYASVGWVPLMCVGSLFTLYSVDVDSLSPVFQHSPYLELSNNCDDNPTYQGPLYHAARWMGNDTLLLLASRQDGEIEARYPALLIRQGNTWAFRPCWP